MQRPCITPSIKCGSDLDVVESCGDVCDDPKNEPASHPRRANDHSHVLTSKPQRNHAKEVEHPVDRKRSVAVSGRVSGRNFGNLGLGLDWVGVGKVDLERHGDEGVRERQEDICTERRAPSPYYELVELQRWMAFGVDVLHMDRQVERETEEGYDDQVDKTNGYCGNTSVRIERPQVEFRESDSWIDGLWDGLYIAQDCGIRRIL